VHLFALDALPVFADETIYIRWSQLIIDDWQRYLFYPMNDGKTPLQMWLMVPFLLIFDNQVWAGRLLSVLVGAISMLALMWSAKLLSKDNKTAYFVALLYIFNPFTFFYNRMAITDALLLCNLSLSFLFTLRYIYHGKISNLLCLSLFFFLSLLSKTPAVLFLPLLYIALLIRPKTLLEYVKDGLFLSAGLFLSTLMFYALRFTPLFGQLFAVGGGFLQSPDKMLSMEIFSSIWRNTQFLTEQLWTYFGLAWLVLAWPIVKSYRRQQIILFLSALFLLSSLIIFGKVLWPRYLLPISIPLILSVALSLTHLSKAKIATFLIIFLLIIKSFSFIYHSYFDVDHIPFTAKDREQYLTEWSSGHGITETTDYILQLAKDKRVAVATEGHFGTLPDGILLNLHRENVDNIYVEGIGQPIVQINPDFITKAAGADITLLVVNSHRLKMNLPKEDLLKEFCRVDQAPCLQVWELHLDE
jgi:4-amino-4-deoxy-L-arabinose transferase-like glycosyltransferase